MESTHTKTIFEAEPLLELCKYMHETPFSAQQQHSPPFALVGQK
jgi:hypothetical protein